jgi:hypothetical protein
MKKIILILSAIFILLCIILYYGCNTINFYEKIDGEDKFVISDKITEDNLYIRFNYLEQKKHYPWCDFEIYLHYLNAAQKTNFHTISASYDIYDINGNKEIIPYEENVDTINGTIHKRYKYSLFFPKKVLARIKLNFYYNEKYYEYFYDAIIIKKRNVNWWSIVKGI